MHVKQINGECQQYTLRQLRRDNPQVSFPKAPTDALLAEYGVYRYTRPAQPVVDWLTSKVVDGSFEQDINGNWVQPYVVEQLPTADAQMSVRNQRDNLLQQTDWMALNDVTMPSEWAAYRQALRDVTAQGGFPYSVVWPTKPE